MKRCIYCNIEKEDTEFSKEHVLPKAIGGVIEPQNPFITNLVCKSCNNTAGLFIDAPFIKSWIINNYRASNAANYIKITPATIVPLTYMGIVNGVKYKNYNCELYLGPTGDLIYHFHLPYPEEANSYSMVGIPPHLKGKGIDTGFAFIFLCSDNKLWWPTIFYSFSEYFKKTIKYFGNGVTPKVVGHKFYEIPSELKNLHTTLWNMQGKQHDVSVQFSIDFDTRFLIKIALGLGSIFLHDEFKESEDANLLRRCMWTRDRKEREGKLHGVGILGGNQMDFIKKVLNYEGGHVINFMIIDGRLALYTNFYGQLSSLIQVTNNLNHWKGIINENMLFIVMPEMQKVVGPLSTEEFISHKTGFKLNTELSEIEKVIGAIEKLPLARLDPNNFIKN